MCLALVLEDERTKHDARHMEQQVTEDFEPIVKSLPRAECECKAYQPLPSTPYCYTVTSPIKVIAQLAQKWVEKGETDDTRHPRYDVDANGRSPFLPTQQGLKLQQVQNKTDEYENKNWRGTQ